jgi:hypothetical protein
VDIAEDTRAGEAVTDGRGHSVELSAIWSLSMAIDDSGRWWVGSEPADIQEFLEAFTESEGGYRCSAFRLVRCPCGSEQFMLQRAAEVTRRTCAACDANKLICREAEDWEEAEAEEGTEGYSCIECGSPYANIGVGFASYDEAPEINVVKWFYVGVRCAVCGVLGCFNDGKVGPGSHCLRDHIGIIVGGRGASRWPRTERN